MVSSTTKFSPAEARGPRGPFDGNINLELHRKRTRKYANIEIGDKVKIYKKKANCGKENTKALDNCFLP